MNPTIRNAKEIGRLINGLCSIRRAFEALSDLEGWVRSLAGSLHLRNVATAQRRAEKNI